MRMDVKFRHVFFAGAIGALLAIIGMVLAIGIIGTANAAERGPGGQANPPADQKAFYPLGECAANVVLQGYEVRLMTCTFVAPANVGTADFVQAALQTGAFDRIRGWVAYAGTDRQFPTNVVVVNYFLENTVYRPAVAVTTVSAVLFHVPTFGPLQMETPKAAALGVVSGQ